MNGCSYFPDNFLWLGLTGVCDIHDEHYAEQEVSRQEADLQLRINVQSIRTPQQITSGKFRAYFTGWLMWSGVRLFGGFAW